MIGVAFALEKTFGISNAVESGAFRLVLREFARLRVSNFDAARFDSATIGEALNVGSVAELREAFSAALQPDLLSEAEATQLEALFRIQAAQSLTGRFAPFDDVAPTLRELASLNIPSVALSGGWPSIDQRKAQMVGFAGPIIFAQDLRIEASEPAAFARITQTLLLPADRIWFVGTNAHTEILPAAAAGMRTIWINRDEETFPSSRSLPDATVTSFAQLLGELSEPYTRGLLALRHLLRRS